MGQININHIQKTMDIINEKDYLTIRDLSLLTGFSEVSIRTHISRPEFERYRIQGCMKPLRYEKSQELINKLNKYIKTKTRAWGYV